MFKLPLLIIWLTKLSVVMPEALKKQENPYLVGQQEDEHESNSCMRMGSLTECGVPFA